MNVFINNIYMTARVENANGKTFTQHNAIWAHDYIRFVLPGNSWARLKKSDFFNNSKFNIMHQYNLI